MVLLAVGRKANCQAEAVRRATRSIEAALAGTGGIDKKAVGTTVKIVMELTERLNNSFRLVTATIGMTPQDRIRLAESLIECAEGEVLLAINGPFRKLEEMADRDPRPEFVQAVVKLAPALANLRAAVEKAEEAKERFLGSRAT